MSDRCQATLDCFSSSRNELLASLQARLDDLVFGSCTCKPLYPLVPARWHAVGYRVVTPQPGVGRKQRVIFFDVGAGEKDNAIRSFFANLPHGRAQTLVAPRLPCA